MIGRQDMETCVASGATEGYMWGYEVLGLHWGLILGACTRDLWLHKRASWDLRLQEWGGGGGGGQG